jgi:hypothetical protein
LERIGIAADAGHLRHRGLRRLGPVRIVMADCRRKSNEGKQ